jgi:hypothetical protein
MWVVRQAPSIVHLSVILCLIVTVPVLIISMIMLVCHTIWTVNQIVSLQEDFFGATVYLLFCLGVISIQSQGPP